MEKIKISRRTLLVGSAAATALAVSPISVAAEPAPAIAAEIGWWGYSTDGGDFFHVAASEEEAISIVSEEVKNSLYPMITAYCVEEPTRCPDARECVEEISNWLCDTDGSLTDAMVRLISHANEEIAYEGELLDYIDSADTQSLKVDVWCALEAAFLRAGRSDLIVKTEKVLADREEDVVGPNDPIHSALAADALLGADLVAACRKWIAVEKFDDVRPRCVQISNEREFQPPEEIDT